MRRVFILVVALILYGSLYPWHFAYPWLPHGPLLYLLNRWDGNEGSYRLPDVAINIALYAPIGIIGHFLFKKVYSPVLFGLALSFLVEFTQIYIPGRQPTTLDILSNTAGAAIGLMLAILLQSITWRPAPRVPRLIAWVFLLVIVLARLRGVHLSGTHGEFLWVPFANLLNGDPKAGFMVLVAKMIAYSSAIALFRVSGVRWATAVALGAGVIALTEGVRWFAPATAAGITDPLIALIGGFVLANLFPETGRQFRSAE